VPALNGYELQKELGLADGLRICPRHAGLALGLCVDSLGLQTRLRRRAIPGRSSQWLGVSGTHTTNYFVQQITPIATVRSTYGVPG
jgi:hypothetical protein